jgi:two-component system nitrogen regulation response regulator GlnG
LEHAGLRVSLAHSAELGLKRFEEDRPSVVLLDLRLDEESGLDVLRHIRAVDHSVPVIMFTAFSTTEAAIEATQSGAFDYMLKPVDLVRLKDAVERALAARAAAGDAQRIDANPPPASAGVGIIGSSPAMQEVFKKIGRFAGSTGSVLILGESGTGKELVARALHLHSKRRDGEFVAINCAALSETLLESDLFGHEKGAFTGADKRRIGKFEYANGGTIFLDEIGDMSPVTQAKVLRLIQERRFQRLGGNETIATDVRIVAATNKDLESLVQDGSFREDLYYRLNVFCVRLPPLRKRLGDLPELVTFFINSFKDEFGKNRVRIESGVMSLLDRYDWPGNLRELQSVVKYALAHATDDTLRVENLPESLCRGAATGGARTPPSAFDRDSMQELVERLLEHGEADIYDRAVALMDRIVIPRVLRHTQGNLQHACELLGISRNTLKGKMRSCNVQIERSVSLADAESRDGTLHEVVVRPVPKATPRI